uniref:RING-type domain-containing protein n=1 Tax=Parastrongyloides trichosuri TaxID=131310 RepID=A0A0N4ZCV2_PARTI
MEISSKSLFCNLGCLEEFADSDLAFLTTCGHLFHNQCIIRHLRESNSCPLCRENCTISNVKMVFLPNRSIESVPERMTQTIKEKNETIKLLEEKINVLENIILHQAKLLDINKIIQSK